MQALYAKMTWLFRWYVFDVQIFRQTNMYDISWLELNWSFFFGHFAYCFIYKLNSKKKQQVFKWHIRSSPFDFDEHLWVNPLILKEAIIKAASQFWLNL